jgi:hypothetical protein
VEYVIAQGAVIDALGAVHLRKLTIKPPVPSEIKRRLIAPITVPLLSNQEERHVIASVTPLMAASLMGGR